MKKYCIMCVDDPRKKGGIITVINNFLKNYPSEIDIIFVNLSAFNSKSIGFLGSFFKANKKQTFAFSKYHKNNLYEFPTKFKEVEFLRILPTNLLNQKIKDYENIIFISGSPFLSLLAIKFADRVTIWSPSLLLKERFLTIILSIRNFRFSKYVLSAIICFPILLVLETFAIIKAKKICMMNTSYNKYVSVIRKIFFKKESITVYPISYE